MRSVANSINSRSAHKPLLKINSQKRDFSSFLKRSVLTESRLPTAVTNFFEKFNLGLFGLFFSLQKNSAEGSHTIDNFLEFLETMQLLAFPFKQSVCFIIA